MQTALLVAVPTVTVLIGILFNRQDSNALRAEMVTLRNTIHADMVGVHERLAAVETRQNR